MNIKNNLKVLWNYLKDGFEPEEIEAAFEETMDGFEYEPAQINDEMIEALPDAKASTLFFDIGYMAVNGLFGGDWDTWYEVLHYSLAFDDSTIEFLNF
jgi:hypothetical protein